MHSREDGSPLSETLVLLAMLTTACSASPRLPGEPAPPPRPPNEAERTCAEAERHWAARGDAEELARAIAAWRRAAELDPTQRATFAHLAHAYHFLGEHELAFDDGGAGEAVDAFAEGARAAERALDGSSATPPDGTGSDAAHALYWRALNRSGWATTRGYLAVITTQDEVRDALATCLAADPDYDHAGPDRHLGEFYASPPAFPERDLERAREHFRHALTRAEGFLATRVALAETLAVATQSRDTFESELRRVLDAKVDALPGLAPENRLAQRRALTLLERADDLFE